MKKIFLLLTLLQILNLNAQDDAFTNEVENINGLLYFSNKPFTGTLFSSEDNIPNKCDCLLKAKYSDGKLNGLKEEWYASGQKKLEETYIKNNLIEEKKYFPNGNLQLHKKFNASNFNEKLYVKIMYENDKTKEETHFKNNQLLDHKNYYSNGNLKYHLKHNPNKLSEIIYEKYFFENGVVKREAYFKDNLPDNNYIENFSNGNAQKKIKYYKGNIIKKNIYREDGALEESLLPVNNSNYFENIHYYENGKIKLKGYLSKKNKKDSVWTTFDQQENRISEKVYAQGRLELEGKYKNNLKNGIWKHYLQDGITQKNITYQLGNEIKTDTFNINHLFNNNYDSTNDVAIFQFIKLNGNKENIVITSDRPFTQDRTEQLILGFIAKKFLERMKMLHNKDINEHIVISKKIHISNMEVKYTSSTYTDNLGSGELLTGYDAFIHLDLEMKDIDNNKLFSKSYKMNKSDKLLNSLLNTAAQTFARTEDIAFKSALKSIKFKKLFKKYFPVNKKLKKK